MTEKSRYRKKASSSKPRDGKIVNLIENNYKIIVILLLVAFSAQVIYAILTYSPTYDEMKHVNAAYKYLRTGNYDIDVEHPPLIALNGLPALAGNFSLPDNMMHDVYGDEFEQLLVYSRLITLFYGLLLGIFVFLWAKDLFGISGGLLALFLYSFEPNMIAFSSLVATDLLGTCFIFIAMYFFFRFITRTSFLNATLSGIFLGVSIVAKFTAVYMFLLVLIVGLICSWKKTERLKYLGLLALIFVFALFVINGAYLFKGTFDPYSRADVHNFKFLNSLRAHPAVKDIPVPLPEKFIVGINYVKWHTSKHFAPAFLMGKYAEHGFWYYFFVAILIKTPIPLLLLFLLCVMLLFTSILSGKQKRGALFLLIPVLLLLVLVSFFNNLNIGLRHILPIYPFLIVLASASILFFKNNQNRQVVLCILLIWYVVSAVFVAPDYLSYFNELIGGSKYGYRYLIDSNIDWGQGAKAVKEYMEKSEVPISREVGCTYTPGKFIFPANDLVGLGGPNDCLKWLREQTPERAIGGFILFNVPNKTVQNKTADDAGQKV